MKIALEVHHQWLCAPKHGTNMVQACFGKARRDVNPPPHTHTHPSTRNGNTHTVTDEALLAFMVLLNADGFIGRERAAL